MTIQSTRGGRKIPIPNRAQLGDCHAVEVIVVGGIPEHWTSTCRGIIGARKKTTKPVTRINASGLFYS
ncbi:hypothetical protein AUG19_09110 [archaeon 13_1_20CM_2_54_9]|nr:MAG: hypothetical protein AUG19_09110 [archaeon 13_1_20CM_2_54_9]